MYIVLIDWSTTEILVQIVILDVIFNSRSVIPFEFDGMYNLLPMLTDWWEGRTGRASPAVPFQIESRDFLAEIDQSATFPSIEQESRAIDHRGKIQTGNIVTMNTLLFSSNNHLFTWENEIESLYAGGRCGN